MTDALDGHVAFLKDIPEGEGGPPAREARFWVHEINAILNLISADFIDLGFSRRSLFEGDFEGFIDETQRINTKYLLHSLMWRGLELALISECHRVCEFSEPILIDETAPPGSPRVTWDLLHEAAQWARSKGYKTLDALDGWRNPPLPDEESLNLADMVIPRKRV